VKQKSGRVHSGDPDNPKVNGQDSHHQVHTRDTCYLVSTTAIGTIIAGNNGTDVGPGGEIKSLGSLIGTKAAGTSLVDQGGTLTGLNPQLGPLQDNGGPTLTHALLPGSPAINTGPTSEPSFPGDAFDQRGDGFVRVVNGQVDIGAYEVQAVVIQPNFTG
jgi:hypothetical protein